MKTMIRRSLGTFAVAATAFTGIASTAVVTSSSANAAGRTLHTWTYSMEDHNFTTKAACQNDFNQKMGIIHSHKLHLNSYHPCTFYKHPFTTRGDWSGQICYNAPVRMLSRIDYQGYPGPRMV